MHTFGRRVLWAIQIAVFACSVFLPLVFGPVSALAQTNKTTTTTSCPPTGTTAPKSGLLSGGVSPDCAKCGDCKLADFFAVGNNVIKLILGLSGSVMLLMVVYGGFLWLISAGDSGKIEQGKNILKNSVIGLVIVFISYSAVQLILSAIGVTNVPELFKLPFKR